MPTISLNPWSTTRPDQGDNRLPITMMGARNVQRASMTVQTRTSSSSMSGVSTCIELGTVLEQSISSPPPSLARDIGTRFGVRLRDLRRSHRLTQLDMAITFGIDRSYISDVECGKKGISLATLEVIALGFGMKLSDLFENL